MASKITTAMIEQVYEAAKDIYEQKVTRKDAIATLVSNTGMKASSADYYIYGLGMYPSPELINEITWEEKVLVFSSVWGIVDQAHVLCQLLKKFEDGPPRNSSIGIPKVEVSKVSK